MVGISLFIDIAVSGRKGGSMGSFVCFGIVETTCNRETSGCHSVSARLTLEHYTCLPNKQVSRIL